MASSRRLAAIMFSDLAGFTNRSQRDEADALRALHDFRAAVTPLFAEFGGRQIKSLGDGLLVEFGSALRATECAVRMQERVAELNAESQKEPLGLRIGLHVGDVVHEAEDVLGDTVNVASRLEPLAGPGGICVSGQVYEDVRYKIAGSFEKVGNLELKGLRSKLDVYRLRREPPRPEPVPPEDHRSRIAVLPFANISPDPRDEYFADGLTEELISVLSQLPGLRVIARTSVSQYKTAPKPVSVIGSELGVSSVLEGSVRKAGSRIRITIQLIDVATQEHKWAETYNRELEDVFALQAEIAERTAGALRLRLLESDRKALAGRSAPNLAAYELYLQGIAAAHRPSSEEIAQSIQYFEGAIRADPEFPRAYAYLANTLIFLAGEGVPAREAFPRARELVRRALELDPNSSEAHTARGNLALQAEHDWNRADTELRRALELNPNSSLAHFWYAMLLITLQRFDQAKAELHTTIELDPLWEFPQGWLSDAYALSGQFDTAIRLERTAMERDPGDLSHHGSIARICLRAGRFEEARREAALWVTTPTSADRLSWAILLARLGQPQDARRLLAEREAGSLVEIVSASVVAKLYASLGELDRAIDLLESCSEEVNDLWFHYQDGAFDPIRSDPRFLSLLRRMNLPAGASWNATPRGPGA